MNYSQARTNHECLWGCAPASDMTGRHVDREGLAKMLRRPSKAAPVGRRTRAPLGNPPAAARRRWEIFAGSFLSVTPFVFSVG